MLKRIIFTGLMVGMVLVLAAAFQPRPVQAADVVKIGVIDLQTAINDSKKGQGAKAALVKKFEKRQNELSTRESELQKMQEDLERQSAMLSPEAKYEKEKTLKRKMRDFQDIYRDYSEQMKKDEMESTQPIVEGILLEAHNYGKENGFTLILEAKKAGVLYVPDSMDITAEVVKRYDAK